MTIIALSNYDGDVDTRFGDCIMLIDRNSIVIYDCGHEKHAEYIEKYIEAHKEIDDISIVISHNDSDHTKGICALLDWCKENGLNDVKIYAHLYLKYVDDILPKIKNKKQKQRETLKEDILEQFNHICEIVLKAERHHFDVINAEKGTQIGKCVIVGPEKNEITDTVARAVDERQEDTIGDGLAEETVMNAASVQLKFLFDNNAAGLLCGDASPDFLRNLSQYDLIQLPHHGQKDDAAEIFRKLGGYAHGKTYLISDNTGSAENSGGSEKLVKYMNDEKYKSAYNTKNGIIELTQVEKFTSYTNSGRSFLGDLDSYKKTNS